MSLDVEGVRKSAEQVELLDNRTLEDTGPSMREKQVMQKVYFLHRREGHLHR